MNEMTAKIAQHMMHVLYFDLSRYLIAAGGMTAVLWLCGRWLTHRRIQIRRANAADYRREVLSSLRTVLVFGIATISTLLLREAGIIHFSLRTFEPWQLVLHSVVIIVAHDAWFYWMHRSLHHKRVFRATHLHHHKSRTPTPWAAYSFSSWEAVAEVAFVPLFLLATSLMGFAWVGWSIFIFLWHMIIRNVIGHCGTEIYPRGWVDNRLTGWWNTVTHHDLHHQPGGYNFNYGLYFTWWDRWMGTEHPRYREEFRKVTERGREETGSSALPV